MGHLTAPGRSRPRQMSRNSTDLNNRDGQVVTNGSGRCVRTGGVSICVECFVLLKMGWKLFFYLS
jgi:hypothetical protein